MMLGFQGPLRSIALAGLAIGVAGCSGNQAPKADNEGPRPGPQREYSERDGSVFGDDGFDLNVFSNGSVSGSTDPGQGGLPVNKFLWQASLDTLEFLPLASTDPFTGVIATDWGAAPNRPGERFKVTAYMVRPALEASSLKVAVYREIRNEEGLWLPATVDPETPRKIEDAILVRARQIRIAEIEGKTTG